MFRDDLPSPRPHVSASSLHRRRYNDYGDTNMKWLFWYGGGGLSAVLLFGWLAWNGAAGSAPAPGRDAFESPPAGLGVTPKDVLLYVALTLLSVWLIALIVAAIVRMRRVRRETAADAATSDQ